MENENVERPIERPMAGESSRADRNMLFAYEVISKVHSLAIYLSLLPRVAHICVLLLRMLA